LCSPRTCIAREREGSARGERGRQRARESAREKERERARERARESERERGGEREQGRKAHEAGGGREEGRSEDGERAWYFVRITFVQKNRATFGSSHAAAPTPA
jgi:hypothetical protein